MFGLFFRETFRCSAILDAFLDGNEPSLDDFKRSLFIKERGNDPYKADYFYRERYNKTVRGWQSWRDVVKGALEGLSTTFLERGGRRHICVRYDRFSEWQHVLAEISPLAVVAWRLQKEFGELPFDGAPADLGKAIEKKIMPQFRHSALPTVHDPRLDRLIEREGVDDLHVHLNGSSEMERVWLDTLANLQPFIKNFMKGAGRAEVIEQLAQDEPELTHAKFVKRVRAAARVQRLLVRLVMPALLVPDDPRHLAEPKPDLADGASIPWLSLMNPDHIDADGQPIAFLPLPPDAAGIVPLSSWPTQWKTHPLETVLTCLRGRDDVPPLTAEAVLLIGAYQRLDDRDGEVVAQTLFVYLSLLCLFGRIIVQQRSQIGFDQFQKITVNQARERLEKSTYVDRLKQAEYTPTGDIDVLEGRFAPKTKTKDMHELLGAIQSAYQQYRNMSEREWTELQPAGKADAVAEMETGRRLRLRLVAHFTKQPDRREVTAYRHHQLHRMLRLQATALLNSIDRYRVTPIVGFDAAANELHAPPEVFAPVFRKLRRAGHQNYTYHAGEDFRHLLSGIRTIVETIEFLDMTTGNRIGHGTAVGIDPVLWRERAGQSVTLSSIEWLDNLVLANDLLKRAGNVSGAMKLNGCIAKLSALIYGCSYPAEILMQAWRLRKLDPRVAFGGDGRPEDNITGDLKEEFDLVKQEKENKTAFDIWSAYHSDDVYKKGGELITLGEEFPDEFQPDDLRTMQEQVLVLMRDRRLVLETLPTSNVRISYYKNHGEHHILRWLGVTGRRAPVPVVVGSDDPGIFATNMRNEYAHILRELECRCLGGQPEALAHIEWLIENGKTWRFRSDPDLERAAEVEIRSKKSMA